MVLSRAVLCDKFNDGLQKNSYITPSDAGFTSKPEMTYLRFNYR